MSEQNTTVTAALNPDALRVLAETIREKTIGLAAYVNALAGFDERAHVAFLGEECRRAVVQRTQTLETVLVHLGLATS